jgi:hypothetical protein
LDLCVLSVTMIGPGVAGARHATGLTKAAERAKTEQLC